MNGPRPDTTGFPDMQEPLYTRILHALVSEIVDGTLLPGDRLMENRVARRFGVSRAPARKALAELETLGLIDGLVAPARGYVIHREAPQRAATLAPANGLPFSSHMSPTWQRVYREVEDALTQRIAFGGWRLTEAGIAREFDVSRTVAREVLARLQAHGLVANEGKGWIAPELSQTRVSDLYELRAILEPEALRDVGAQLPESHLDQMIDDLQSVAGTVVDGHRLDQFEADLHVDLLQRCKNLALRRAMTEAQSLLLAHKFFYQHTAGTYPVEPFLEEHLQILLPLRHGAIHDACDQLRRHLIRSSDRATLRIATLRGTYRTAPLSYLEPLP